MKAIFASDLAQGFGYEGRLPWPRNKTDARFFQNQTSNNYIVMGRKTYERLPDLPYRIPIVVTSSVIENVRTLDSRTDFVDELKEFDKRAGKDVFLIGGAQLLTPEALKACSAVYHTTFKDTFPADTYINPDSMTYLSTIKHTIIHEDSLIIIRKYETV